MMTIPLSLWKSQSYFFYFQDALLMMYSFASISASQDFRVNLTASLAAISKHSHYIQSSIPHWHSYEYDEQTTEVHSITDGGKGMFNSGNQVVVSEISTTPSSHNIIYNTTYNYSQANFLAQTIHPFVGLLRINNTAKDHMAYSVGVYGYGSKGSTISKFNGNFTSGNFYMEYYVFQTSGSNHPSICEVYFLLSNAKNWKSQSPSESRIRFGVDPYSLDNRLSIAGTPSHVVMGYTLLSKYPSKRVTNDEVRKVLALFMRILGKDVKDNCPFLPQSCHKDAYCLETPSQFKCICKKGYDGDGVMCNDTDECFSGHDCAFDAICKNTPGSYKCLCPSGFSEDGTAGCSDMNECELETHNCHPAANCFNKWGSYDCECKSGYKGDGYTCGAYTTNCYDDSMVFRISSKLFDNMDVAVGDFYLKDYKCQGDIDKDNLDVWIFNMTTLDSCGTVMHTNKTHLIYTNTLMNWIYTDSAQMISFSCSYKKDLENITFLSSSYKVLRSVANLTAPTGKGEYTAVINRYTDNTYSEIDRRNRYKTTDTIYVLFKLQTSYKSLNLIIDKCWITASTNPQDEMSYSFIENGCTRRKLGHVNITRSGRGNIAHFESKIFAFTNHDTSFIHCSLQICLAEKMETCVPGCLGESRGILKRSVTTGLKCVNCKAGNRVKRQSGGSGNVLSLGPLSTIPATQTTKSTNNDSFMIFLLPIMITLMISSICSIISCFALVTYWMTRKNHLGQASSHIK